MLKIGIDARLYSQTGVGVYLKNLLFYLNKISNQQLLFYVYLLQPDYERINFLNSNFIKRLVNSSWHSFSEQIYFPRILYKDNLDLMHFTYFSYPILYRKKFIATIHDTTPLFYKTGKASTKNQMLYEIKFQAFKLVLSEQVKHARFIITPTETVKEELLKTYGDKYQDIIKPIYEGVNYELSRIQNSISVKSGQNFNHKNFFIYIGNFYPHKNVENLVRAFVKIRTDVKLVLIGPGDFFSKRLLESINRLKQEKRIFFYHNPTKEDLVFFYRNAKALIHPSLSEGFGLPIVEAASFNLPIIASDITVFKELLGNNYISFNPKDIDDIAAKINFFLKSDTETDYSKVLQKYSFRKMAIKTMRLYNEALR